MPKSITAVKERPILFSAPMIRALLEGRKTQTRRIVKPQPDGRTVALERWARGLADACGVSPTREEIFAKADRLRGRVFPFEREESEALYSPTCPYGYPGERLWVKETHLYCEATLDSLNARNGESRIVKDTHVEGGPAVEVFYKATAGTHTRFILETGSDLKWRSPIHMHRWASRLTLEITDVRVQRVEEISEQNAIAEGIVSDQCADGRVYQCRGAEDWHRTAREAFLALFYDINKRAKRGENPWVWALTFKVLDHA